MSLTSRTERSHILTCRRVLSFVAVLVTWESSADGKPMGSFSHRLTRFSQIADGMRVGISPRRAQRDFTKDEGKRKSYPKVGSWESSLNLKMAVEL